MSCIFVSHLLINCVRFFINMLKMSEFFVWQIYTWKMHFFAITIAFQSCVVWPLFLIWLNNSICRFKESQWWHVLDQGLDGEITFLFWWLIVDCLTLSDKWYKYIHVWKDLLARLKLIKRRHKGRFNHNNMITTVLLNDVEWILNYCKTQVSLHKVHLTVLIPTTLCYFTSRKSTLNQ